LKTKVLAAAALISLLLGAGCADEEGKSVKKAAQPAPKAMAPTITQQASQAAPAPVPSKSAEPASPAPKQVSTTEQIIARAEAEYARGEANYRAGHLEAAKDSFDRAFDIVLSGPVGVHQDEALEREFDKIVERVHSLEEIALQQGDGFTEQKPEPAPIDEANEVTFPVDPAVRARAEKELTQVKSDLPLVMNDYVASYISYFSSSSRGHAAVENAYIRSGRYRDMIQRVLKEEGVPQDLMYLAQAESGFHPLALSRAGARGMWQFMASRAVDYGLRRNWWMDERQDPEKSTRAAARHLRDLYNEFGDWYLAMAAYNSGPGTVQHAVERTGYADFWELYRRGVLPGETRNYVPIIVAMTIIGKNPAQYGLDKAAQAQPIPSETVKLNYAVDLRLVAECTDSSVSVLQELNPSLLRMTTPRDLDFTLRVPAGTAAKFQDAIAAIPEDMRTYWRYHRVRSGESLTEIAHTYHTTSTAIAEVNNLNSDAELQKDMKLVIPVSRSSASAKADTGNGSYSKRVTYKVRKGDTVLSVADDYGVPVDRLRKWNHLSGNTLKVGRTLTIYRPEASAKETSASSRRSRRSRVSEDDDDPAPQTSRKSSAHRKGSTHKKAVTAEEPTTKKGRSSASRSGKSGTKSARSGSGSESKKSFRSSKKRHHEAD
jgi:membrane-bound lytic murein transglycosylase D